MLSFLRWFRLFGSLKNNEEITDEGQDEKLQQGTSNERIWNGESVIFIESLHETISCSWNFGSVDGGICVKTVVAGSVQTQGRRRKTRGPAQLCTTAVRAALTACLSHVMSGKDTLGWNVICVLAKERFLPSVQRTNQNPAQNLTWLGQLLRVHWLQRVFVCKR